MLGVLDAFAKPLENLPFQDDYQNLLMKEGGVVFYVSLGRSEEHLSFISINAGNHVPFSRRLYT